MSKAIDFVLGEPDMSHHFDTPTAREDPRVNLCGPKTVGGRSTGKQDRDGCDWAPRNEPVFSVVSD
jgi:hypothetical protein